MRIIHDPPPPHRCDTPSTSGYATGAVARCEECGTFYVNTRGEYGTWWRRVLPWPCDRKARRIIREWEAEQ